MRFRLRATASTPEWALSAATFAALSARTNAYLQAVAAAALSRISPELFDLALGEMLNSYECVLGGAGAYQFVQLGLNGRAV